MKTGLHRFLHSMVFGFCVCMALALPLVAQEVTGADRIKAGEEFRRGVQSFHRGSFNEAILLFEKALSYIPGEPLILDWLGRSYYRSGIEGAALQQWRFASDAGYGGPLLSTRIEIVQERRTIRPDYLLSERFVEAAVLPSVKERTRLFNQPVSLAALPDGSFWAAAYGSNELVRFDVNGLIIARARGPLGGFDRPFDLIRLSSGNLLVSEMGADRLSLVRPDGQYLSSFGTKGRGTGQLVGPQYIAEDDYGNIYVTDFGNARIAVFTPAGEPLFVFGSKDARFPGFLSPGGLAWYEDRLYAADSLRGSLHVFDSSGNFIETLLPEGSLVRSEAIRVWQGRLLVSLPNRLVLVDPATGASRDLASLGNAPARITCAVPDINGNLVLADYRGNSIQIMSRMSDLAGGLFVQIERVVSDRFPEMILEVRVEDRNRRPVTGLKAANFRLTEDRRPAANVRLAGAAALNDVCDITVLIDRSPASEQHMSEIRAAIAEIAAAMNGTGTLRLVSAGSVPLPEGSGNPASGAWGALRLKAPAALDWAFDLGLRLAVNELVNAEKRRAVIFLSAGDIGPRAFSRYGLSDLAAYMNNNGVIFSTVYLSQSAALPELEYLSAQTGGQDAYVWRRQGLTSLVESIREAPNGSYQLTWTSTLPTDFGRALLPVEVETWLMNRSGRDETAYFAPLE